MKPRLILLLFVMAGLIVAFAPLSVPAIAPQERTFRINARQFAFSPSELKVNVGDTVTLQLVSTDVVHGLYVDDYDISVEADPGQTQALTFTAEKSGSFRFRCNITCGAMHPFMIGKLTVGTNDWLLRSVGLAALAVIGVIVSRKQNTEFQAFLLLEFCEQKATSRSNNGSLLFPLP